MTSGKYIKTKRHILNQIASRREHGWNKNPEEVNKKISKSLKGIKSSKKSKTYEEFYGVERSKEIIKKQSEVKFIPRETRVCACGCEQSFRCKINSIKRFSQGHYNKGKTYEQLYGIEKAKELKLNYKKNRAIRQFPYNDTKPELALDKILQQLKLRYVKQKYELEGTPDRFIEPNICIFVDGDYWHANPKFYKSKDLIANNYTAREKWSKDNKITKDLKSQGFKVLRFWEYDIKNDTNKCIEEIKSCLT